VHENIAVLHNNRSGFTLVEIAIVLVIIGLLLGGVFKGQEMITQGRIKAAINDFSGVTAAYYAYLDRYKALPGDDIQANSRWPLLLPSSTSGNGDGTISGAYNATGPAVSESQFFWMHLRAAGLITGSAASGAQPLNSAGGIIGVQTGNGAVPAAEVLESNGAGTGFAGFMICSSGLSDRVAAAVDRQLDDGVPNTGSIRAQLTVTPDTIQTAAMSGSYTDTGTTLVTICKAL
jgi:prepilin-type N-terminal cleavage/methylation domain-containing protein